MLSASVIYYVVNGTAVWSSAVAFTLVQRSAVNGVTTAGGVGETTRLTTMMPMTWSIEVLSPAVETRAEASFIWNIQLPGWWKTLTPGRSIACRFGCAMPSVPDSNTTHGFEAASFVKKLQEALHMHDAEHAADHFRGSEHLIRFQNAHEFMPSHENG
ncbi:hypothetical protein G7Y89_g9956 [Cudoniella acicularis]|uniref:Uncharacterized protein n=1 Tax=Cudoniella acicularis TaxID=354080 RepID=A0A8H4VZI5_9HELO|nr:hypothetical protein G7Y89_g9956 [Cudoniella acicularis]